MRTYISLNGKDIAEYGLTWLDGNLNTLMKPAGFKKLTTNTNSAFDGVIPIITANRKRDSRTITLNFYINSLSLIDLRRDIDNLEAALAQGTGGGVNELYVADVEQCYRLIYEGITSYNTNLEGKAIIAIKFMEFCPTAENRIP
ncbi:MAG: hypothetical protein IJ640_00835 [Prevotella sp.]|nr:hypothetical protein [Prevotella sp.]